jgi:hypothetical protein
VTHPDQQNETLRRSSPDFPLLHQRIRVLVDSRQNLALFSRNEMHHLTPISIIFISLC